MLRFAPLLALSALLAGCQAPAGDTISISHVHGLAFEPSERAVYVATHHGLAKGIEAKGTWTWSYVGSERYDYMGFARDAVVNRTFYSSGHPDDPRAFGGVHLGLRRSTDGGQTWEQRSLKGQVDFHALTSLAEGDGHLAGSWQGVVKISRDAGLTWQDASPMPGVLALASSDGQLWAGTSQGLYRSSDLKSWMPASNGALTGIVSSLAVSRDGTLLFAGTADGQSGSTHRSTDGGQTWQPLTAEAIRNPAAPVLFAIDASNPLHVFASTANGTILESKDGGQAWETIRQG